MLFPIEAATVVIGRFTTCASLKSIATLQSR
jgi:hypothetical protein